MPNDAILVTGASSGIGLATAGLLAVAGYTVFAGVRKESDRARLADAHPSIRPLILDVTASADISRAVETIAGSGERLIGAVNNAGIAVPGPLEYLPVDELRRQFETNTFAPIAVAQAMLPMLRASGGRLVFIGSIGGRISAPFIGPYSASKSALAMLADALRMELRPSGVSVSLLEFASVKTPIWEKGRSGKDATIASLPPHAMKHYGALMDAILKQTEHEERGGLDPLVIAQTVLEALTAQRPRERYVIGRRAKIQAVVAMLPARTRDRLIRRAMSLP